MRVAPVLLLLVPLAVGIGIAALLISRAAPPARVEGAERTAAVTTLVAEARPLAPEVRGYGNVRAAERWAAVAEVAGAITWRLPALEPGNILPAGTEVLRIDPTAYELALAQAEADLAALEADSVQLNVEEENTRRIVLQRCCLEHRQPPLQGLRQAATDVRLPLPGDAEHQQPAPRALRRRLSPGICPGYLQIADRAVGQSSNAELKRPACWRRVQRTAAGRDHRPHAHVVPPRR
jgi:hypothetical protein